MFKIKKGDTVKVIAGKDKDKEGKVLTVDQKNNKVVVEGVNMITKHSKPTAANPNGGIIQKEAAIDASNVMLVHEGKATRVGFKMEGDKKVRFAKATGKVIVEGINMISKHTKPSMANQQGGIVEKEAAIDASNVMLMHEGKATRVGFKVEDGKKVRVAKTTGKVID